MTEPPPPYRSTKIDVISDTICPWCFIGKRRLERALAMRPEITADLTWHPFQLNPDMPEEGIERDLYLSLKFGGALRAKELYRVVGEAGASEQLDFNFAAIKRAPNTLKSHRLVRFANRNDAQDAVVENLFRAYFFHGTDIGAIDNLLDVAESSGLDREQTRRYLESDEDLELIRGQDARARQMGVTGVPCFIIADRYAISGAQEPEVFLQVLDAAGQIEKPRARASGAG